jgi:hypothetical protein
MCDPLAGVLCGPSFDSACFHVRLRNEGTFVSARDVPSNHWGINTRSPSVHNTAAIVLSLESLVTMNREFSNKPPKINFVVFTTG